MKELIPEYDVNGVQLKEGDIVAQSKAGREVWEGQGVVLQRPLGIVFIRKNPYVEPKMPIEKSDFYNIVQIRPGLVQLNKDIAKDFLKSQARKNGDDLYIDLHMSKCDGDFYAWDDLTKVGSIYDLPT